MSQNQKIPGCSNGMRKRPQQALDDDLHLYGEPPTKTRRSEHGFVNGSDDGSDDTWNEEQHRHFVSAIFEIGLKSASPAIILENMNQKVETITSERVKSKLQKYRSSKNKEKSKTEFMNQYMEFLNKIQSIQATTNGSGMTDADPVLLSFLEQSACRSSSNPCSLFLSGGDVAGYLTYCALKENQSQYTNGRKASKSSDDESSDNSTLPTNVLRKGAREYVDNYAGCPIQFPILTEAEKKSSLGIAMTFIAGLFLTMSQHLKRERARAETIGLRSTASTITNSSHQSIQNNENNSNNNIVDYRGDNAGVDV